MIWYIAEVLPRGFFVTLCDDEKTLRPVAALALERLGFSFCLLTDRTLEIIRNRRETVLRPRMYRYLFIQGINPGMLCARRVPGFSGLLKNADGDYAVVTDAEIEHLTGSMKPTYKFIERGKPMRITEGLYEGYTGRVRWHNPKKGLVKLRGDFGAVTLSDGVVEVV